MTSLAPFLIGVLVGLACSFAGIAWLVRIVGT